MLLASRERFALSGLTAGNFNGSYRLRFFRSLHKPHDGKTGDEIEARHDLFHEVEQSAKSAFPATESFIENERRTGRPNDIAKFAEYGNGVGCVTDEIHQHAKYQ